MGMMFLRISDVVSCVKSMKIEIKSLSARLNYLTRYVLQQKRQLDSASKKITFLEQSSRNPMNRSIGVCHSPQSTRSVGCQFSPGSKPRVSVSPTLLDVSSNSESFEGLDNYLEPSNTINLPKYRKSQKRLNPDMSPLQNKCVVSGKKKKRRSSIIPTELRKTKRMVQSPCL
ncbi:hypothetical protein KSF78_0006550 [Schistosoma japonicum]|nr:hypothetical protein KSF78_0006550 [Schistosoma japonicum]KAH8872418.1 hypothetical protein KSF78_0006550 [Schistosoma japonicum]